MAIVERRLAHGALSFWVCVVFEGSQRWHRAGSTRPQAVALERFLKEQLREGRYIPKRPQALHYDDVLPTNVPGVYAVAGVPGYVKIGCAKQSIASRMRELQVGHPVELRLLGILHDEPAMEPLFHAEFKAWRVHGEWFLLSPPIIDAINRANETVLRNAVEESGSA